MKVVIENPDGNPYITLREDDRLVYIEIEDYVFDGGPVEFNFDKRTIPALIEALQKLEKGESTKAARMNALIETLAKQAGMVEYPTGLGISENTIWGDRNIAQFAELVAQECMALCLRSVQAQLRTTH